MEFKSKYITADEFKLFSGIDLKYELADDDNASNKVNAFLYRIETRMSNFLDANFYHKIEIEYPKFSDYQKEHYKLALLEQALYVLKNSDIAVDSGYDPTRGEIITNKKLLSKVIAPRAKENLILCNLWNRKIRNRGRNSLDGWWMY